jgi:hypothetical protein
MQLKVLLRIVHEWKEKRVYCLELFKCFLRGRGEFESEEGEAA